MRGRAGANTDGARADDIAYLTALVRERDRARYYATLFAPADIRPDLFALYGFAAEVARIPDQVSEPQLGEIRLQWWRDAIDGMEAGPSGDAPAIRALSETIARRALPTGALADLIDGHRRDLYSDPPAKLSDLEGFLGETQSAVFQLAAVICGSSGAETAEAAGHAGIAYGIARRLAHFGSDRARARTILPADLLAAEGLAPADVFAPDVGPPLWKAALALIRTARSHLLRAEKHAAELSRQLQLPFLPLAIVRPMLDRTERFGMDLLRHPIALSDFRVLASMGLKKLRGVHPTAR